MGREMWWFLKVTLLGLTCEASDSRASSAISAQHSAHCHGGLGPPLQERAERLLSIHNLTSQGLSAVSQPCNSYQVMLEPLSSPSLGPRLS